MKSNEAHNSALSNLHFNMKPMIKLSESKNNADAYLSQNTHISLGLSWF